MIEIARNYKIEFDPDPTAFLVSPLSSIGYKLELHAILAGR